MTQFERPPVRTLAFYLPQFHQIPENDEWWGEGFTEWTNVKAARPLYPGHQQPREPGELGYYDLLDPQAREKQAELAREFGVDAFCYWHYWFGHGRRILERPLREVLHSSSPHLPFAICWANTSWTGVWHGAPNRMLMEQQYPGDDDFRAHFEEVRPLFEDQRYIRVDGKPLFLVFAPTELPDAAHFVALWKDLAVEAGLGGLHMLAMSSDVDAPALQAFDGIVLNAPGDFLRKRSMGRARRALMRLAARPVADVLPAAVRVLLGAPRTFEFRDVVEAARTLPASTKRVFPCVLPGWDNTPRSKRRGLVFKNATPDLFGQYMRSAIEQVKSYPTQERLVFIKAWNEWAEGNVLEPDGKNGRGYLEALRRALRSEADAESTQK